MKKTLLLLLIAFSTCGQLFRAIKPVQPLTIAETGTGQFVTLVKKKAFSGSNKYYFVNSDSTGALPTVAFRYGDVFADSNLVVYPSNYIAYFNCGIYDGLPIATFTLSGGGGERVVNIRRFNDAWWVTQVVNGDPLVDMFQPRGINFLGRGDVDVFYPTITDPRCVAKIASDTTALDGLFFPAAFTTPSGYSYDSLGQTFQLEGSVIVDTTQLIANTTPYVFPANGAQGYFNPGTNQYETNNAMMRLELVESNGSYTLKDNATNFNQNISGAYSFNGGTYPAGALVEKDGLVYYTSSLTNSTPPAFPWEQKTLERRYFISFNSTSTDGFSYAEMSSGINVDAWKGKEIRIFKAYFPTTGELSYISPTSQQIYIPGVEAIQTISGATYYNRHPSQFIDATDRVPRWNEYITSDLNIPSGKDIVIDAKNQFEKSTTTSYGNLGVYSRVSTVSGKRYIFIGDDWLTEIGHPAAYTNGDFDGWWATYKNVRGGLANATNDIKLRFKEKVTDRAINEGASYIMLNNELKAYWTSEFKNVIKQCYDQHNANSTATLSAWTDNIVGTEFNLDKTRSYQDYIDTRSYDDFSADNTRFFYLEPTTSHKYALDVNQIGFYYTDRNPHSLAKMIGQALMSKKYTLPQKVIPTIWNVVETIDQPLLYYQEYYQGRPILSRTKDFVSPHLLRNYAAAACFFGDGIHMWHNGYAISNTAEHYFEPSQYVNGEGRLIYMDATGGYKVVSPLSPNDAVPWSKETNIDWLINGVWAVYKNPAFSDVKAIVASVSTDGGTTYRTGADAFVIGAAVDGQPFAAYKKIGNSYLIYAIDFDGKTVQDIKIIMGGVIKDIKLFGDNASIILINN